MVDIAATLIHWYAENKRELPWRETTDPYRIWISEIILQQTRVVQGLEYFNRFMLRFPDGGTFPTFFLIFRRALRLPAQKFLHS